MSNGNGNVYNVKYSYWYSPLVMLVVIIIFHYAGIYRVSWLPEGYRAAENPYKYNLVDRNPVRRVSSFFDRCSPENMEDCPRNNPYEGLPLP